MEKWGQITTTLPGLKEKASCPEIGCIPLLLQEPALRGLSARRSPPLGQTCRAAGLALPPGGRARGRAADPARSPVALTAVM